VIWILKYKTLLTIKTLPGLVTGTDDLPIADVILDLPSGNDEDDLLNKLLQFVFTDSKIAIVSVSNDATSLIEQSDEVPSKFHPVEFLAIKYLFVKADVYGYPKDNYIMDLIKKGCDGVNLTTDTNTVTVSRAEAIQEKKKARIQEHNTIVDLTTESSIGTKAMASRTQQLYVEGKYMNDQFLMLKSLLESGAITQATFNEEAAEIYESNKANREEYVKFKQTYNKSEGKRIEKITEIRLPEAKKPKIESKRVALFPVTPPTNASSSSSSSS
jgi:hypothetical protein